MGLWVLRGGWGEDEGAWEGDVYSSFGWSADSGTSSFGAAGLSSVAVAAGSSFVTSMSEVQRVRLSRSNCYD